MTSVCQYQLIILLSCVSHWSPIFVLSLCIRIAKSLVSLGKKIIWMCIYWANEWEKMSLKRKFIFNKRTPHPHHNILIINYRMLVHWWLFGPWIVDLCSMPPLHFFLSLCSLCINTNITLCFRTLHIIN